MSERYEAYGQISDDKVLDMIANLSKEVSKLRRELSDLTTSIQAQTYEDGEKVRDIYAKVEMLIDDIVMLDERTQGVNNDGQKLLSKEVYIYDTE